MGILSRVFKSFGVHGYTPSMAESKALSAVRIADQSDDTLGSKLRSAKERIKAIKRSTVASWNLYPPSPDLLPTDRSMPTYWGEGKPQTMTYQQVGLMMLGICADMRRYLWGGRKPSGNIGKAQYLCRFWEGSLARLFTDPECAWAEIFNSGFTYCLGLRQTNAERIANGKRPLTISKSSVVRHLVSETYRGTNPRGHVWYFSRLDGEWFNANRPYLKIKSKKDAESLIARGYLFGFDRASGQEVRIPIRCAMVVSLDVQHMADPRCERVRMDEMLHKVSESDTLTTDERLVCIAIARNPSATRTEIARILGQESNGPSKGRDWTNDRVKSISRKVPGILEDMQLAD